MVFNKIKCLFEGPPLCDYGFMLVIGSTLSVLRFQGTFVPVSWSPLCHERSTETSAQHLLLRPPDGNGQQLALQYQVSSQPAPVMATAPQCQEGPDSACLLWQYHPLDHSSAAAFNLPYSTSSGASSLQAQDRGHTALQRRKYQGKSSDLVWLTAE